MEPQVAGPDAPSTRPLPCPGLLAGHDADDGRQDWNSSAFDPYGEFTDPERESQW
jgi:hypothetical protein